MSTNLSVAVDVTPSGPGESSTRRVPYPDAADRIDQVIYDWPPRRNRHNTERMSIYRVPPNLRDGFDQYYSPRIVAIGPYHHGDEEYSIMEKRKIEYVGRMLGVCTQNSRFFANKFRSKLNFYRGFYSEKFEGEHEDDENFEGEQEDDDNFLTMLLHDGMFVLQFMICLGESPMHLSPQEISDIQNDLCLLGNQLPFPFLEELNKAFCDNREPLSVTRTPIWSNDFTTVAAKALPQISLHSSFPTRRPEPLHILDLVRQTMLPRGLYGNDAKDTQLKQHVSIRSAKKLRAAGVKVKSSERRQPLSYAYFRQGDSRLILAPPLEIQDWSLGLYKNIVALEQCFYIKNQHVTDYLILLEMLSRDGSDELLVKNGVIQNNSTMEGATVRTFFQELFKNIQYATRPFGLCSLCKEVNNHCNRSSRRLIAALRGRTWQIGGGIILVLTLIQTICAVLALFNVSINKKASPS